MSFVFDNLIWLLAAAAGLVQWWKATQEAKEEKQREREFQPTEIEEFEVVPKRRLARTILPPRMPDMVPTPPPILRRSAPEPFVVRTPANEINARELEAQTRLAEQLHQFNKERRDKKREESPISASPKQLVASSLSLQGELRSRKEIRKAFVLKEILERPLGLR